MLQEKLHEFLQQKQVTSQEEVKALAEAITLEPFLALKVFKETYETLTRAEQKTPDPITKELEKTWKASFNAASVLSSLWELQENRDLKITPAEHFTMLFQEVKRYFIDSGIISISYLSGEVKTFLDALLDEFEECYEQDDAHLQNSSVKLAERLMKWFNSKFWEYEKLRKVLGKQVKDDVSFHYWKSQGSKLPIFQSIELQLKKVDWNLPPIERKLYNELKTNVL